MCRHLLDDLSFKKKRVKLLFMTTGQSQENKFIDQNGFLNLKLIVIAINYTR